MRRQRAARHRGANMAKAEQANTNPPRGGSCLGLERWGYGARINVVSRVDYRHGNLVPRAGANGRADGAIAADRRRHIKKGSEKRRKTERSLEALYLSRLSGRK